MYITLELGAGKIDPEFVEKIKRGKDHIYIAVDQCYKISSGMEDIENIIKASIGRELPSGIFLLCNNDIITFTEGLSFKVDKIIANRILEHIPLNKLPLFLFTLRTLIKPTGEFKFIVPDHLYYAKELIRLDKIVNKETSTMKDIYNTLLETTTEFCNEEFDPHLSLWTEELIKFYLEIEGYWKVMKSKSIKIGRRRYIHTTTVPTT